MNVGKAGVVWMSARPLAWPARVVIDATQQLSAMNKLCQRRFTSPEGPINRGDTACFYGWSVSNDLDAYERLGDLDKPFEVSTKDARRQKDRQRLRDSMQCDATPLTFEQYRAGVPCPGCGLPYVDAEPFDFRGTMNLSDDERVRYEAEEARFKEAHRSCASHRKLGPLHLRSKPERRTSCLRRVRRSRAMSSVNATGRSTPDRLTMRR
jgi:hypothetical protein